MAEEVRKVGIVGAGISGLAAAKELARFDPIVFEATDSIGGVWKHCCFRTTKLQTPRKDYEFSDYPWEDRGDSFPTHHEIMDYLRGYATKFDLWRFIRLNSKVVDIRFLGAAGKATHVPGWPPGEDLPQQKLPASPTWEISVLSADSSTSYRFEFLVMCLGKYGDVPRMPAYPYNGGPEVFQGKAMHTLDYCKLDEEGTRQLMKGKRVVIIGYKKSAIDMATECAEANRESSEGEDGKPCTMVIRTLHWTVPHYSIWGLPFYLFFSTRSSQFVHERPNQGRLRSLACLLASPMRWGMSRFIESYLKWKLPLEKYGLVPEHPFVEDYASCQMAILPENFFEEADQGRIRFRRSSKWWFWEKGVILDDGTKLEADVVLLGTGYDGKKKLHSVLPTPYRDLLEDASGVIPLYRGTIHPFIPGMAFIGYMESVSNLHTSELRCKWLSRLLEGQFELPSAEGMYRRTAEEADIMKRTTRFYRRQCISTFSIKHSDEMCQEMGWDPWRKPTWLSEAFSPYSSSDYAQQNQ
ncbi:flavin-dependent monooxygenase 1 isoform X2 [Wolffia australiana]